MRFRSILGASLLLVTGTVIGATTQHFASAGVSSGERTVFVPIVPCRLADTRAAPNTVGPRSAPLAAADTATIDVQESTTECAGEVPVDASALSLNVTALGATAQSFITIWAGGDRPLAASLNPAPGEPPIPNAVTTSLSVDQDFKIFNNAGSVNVVIDVNGYYVDHNHDDRYYTEVEVDAAITETESTLMSAIDDAHEFVFGMMNPMFAPTFEPDKTLNGPGGNPIAVSTSSSGRWLIDAEFGFMISCTSPLVWHYLTVDAVPVISSVLLRSDASASSRSYSGHTETSIPAGDHMVGLAAECVDEPTGGSSGSGFGKVTVAVVE